MLRRKNVQNIISIKEAMKCVGAKSYYTFNRNYIKQGLPLIVVGNSKRVDIRDLEKFVNVHKISKEPSN